MDLTEYIDKHAGETAWIFGKGPSLKGFDFSKAGPLRCAINDVIAHIPACKYGFANDGVAAWRDVYQPHHILFQPVRCMHEFDTRIPGAVDCAVVHYFDDYQDTRIFLPKEQHAQKLSVRRGTLGSAIQILRIMGVSQIVCVGIDGGNAHADGYEFRTRLRHDHFKDYNAIRDNAIDGCELMGIRLRFYNQETKKMNDDGKLYVRMTRDCFVEGVPYASGAIAKFTQGVVRDLIEASSAELFTPPAIKEEEFETEVAQIEAPENAAMPKRGRPKKSK